jgi:hypothetical protein
MFLFMPLQKNHYFAGSFSAFSGADAAGAASAAGADGAAAGASTTAGAAASSFLPHATNIVATKPNMITFFILFSVS